MTHSRDKKKSEAGIPRKKNTLIALDEPSKHDRDKLRALWRTEVSELKGISFDSLEAAIDTLIDRVMNRMGASPHPKREREFLRSLFDVNPEMTAQLRKVLMIR